MYPSQAQAPPAARMSAGPRTQNARSSRRGGSAAPRVTLGGGVGALGLGQGAAGVSGVAGANNNVGGSSMSSSAARAGQHRPAAIKVGVPAGETGGVGGKADYLIVSRIRTQARRL